MKLTVLRHTVTESLPCGLEKWREFFQELGVVDFVQINQVDKTVSDISHIIFKNLMWERDLNSPESIAKDWESHELVHLISVLSKNCMQQSCIYLLEIFDTLWDSCFSDKVMGYCNINPGGDSKPFKSSFMSSISDVQWVVSGMDDELHYPKDLFYDCEAVHSILGASAPYAVPKVRNGKLVSDIGCKVKVTMDDILEILKVWRSSQRPFKASISQTSNLYTFIWKEMATSRHKITEELHSGSCVFVPYASGYSREDVVPGMFLSPEEICWHDPTGCLDQIKEINPQCSLTEMTHCPLKKTLSNIYPGLCDFFIDGCGVHETPPLRSYLQILLQLSTVTLPSQAANADNVLYTTQESDSHALFMELSRLLFDGTRDLHLANFLHMITTMAESGSTEEQTEFFILNSQKMPKLSNEESVWSLPSIPSRTKNDDSPQTSFDSTKSKMKAGNNSNWPPVDWKTAPGFSYARLNGFKTQATAAQPSGSPQKDDSEGTVMETDNVPISIEDD
ncbi:protein NO VEIN-like [Quercus lobata]|uniref:protein NO VEIN-like n=1 Tax=Quercus lobata TaxID=97700 RepID=UPI001244A7B3|nr:protein NO VEIN-like [Quercus lobata]